MSGKFKSSVARFETYIEWFVQYSIKDLIFTLLWIVFVCFITVMMLRNVMKPVVRVFLINWMKKRKKKKGNQPHFKSCPTFHCYVCFNKETCRHVKLLITGFSSSLKRLHGHQKSERNAVCHYAVLLSNVQRGHGSLCHKLWGSVMIIYHMWGGKQRQ